MPFTQPTSRRSAFKATHLTPKTFLVVEHDDVYDEQPYIYVKIVPEANYVVIIDTGCGGASKNRDVEVTSLREFIETVPVVSNSGKPLNEGGKLEYVVVCTHCHYDHILGVEQFSDSTVLASGQSPEFLSTHTLAEHTLCKYLEIPTPSYKPTLVSHNHQITSKSGAPLGLTVLHTPGHTPDSLSLWDPAERMLYVGDTLYAHAPILFPTEGSIVDWWASVSSLLDLTVAVDAKISNPLSMPVRLSSGHTTAAQPADEVIRAARAFVASVLRGQQQVRDRETRRGEVFVSYIQEGSRFSLICPERLIKEAKEKLRL